MSGKKSRSKGNRIEREIVNALREEGVHAERIPLSGAAGGSFSGDLQIEGLWRAEVKARAGGDGFRTIERWLADNDLLFLRKDRQKPLVVLPWDLYIELVKEFRAASSSRRNGLSQPEHSGDDPVFESQ